MYSIEIKLAVISIDLKRSIPKLLLKNMRLPDKWTEWKEKPKDAAAKLLEIICDVNNEWAKLKLFTVDLIDDGLVIVYQCLIPETIPLAEGFEWVDYIKFVESDSPDKLLLENFHAYA